jgi:hypothetical protein
LRFRDFSRVRDVKGQGRVGSLIAWVEGAPAERGVNKQQAANSSGRIASTKLEASIFNIQYPMFKRIRSFLGKHDHYPVSKHRISRISTERTVKKKNKKRKIEYLIFNLQEKHYL